MQGVPIKVMDLPPARIVAPKGFWKSPTPYGVQSTEHTILQSTLASVTTPEMSSYIQYFFRLHRTSEEFQ